MSWNVFISSLSKKVPLIKAVKQALTTLKIEGELIGGDCSFTCIGRYFVDKFLQTPKLQNLTLDLFLKECARYQIKAVIPTRDAELTFFAEHKQRLEEHGIACLVSPLKSLKICQDKLLFAEQLTAWGFPVIPTVENISMFSEQKYVVKERFGAGSRSILLDANLNQAMKHGELLNHPIFQPFIAGQEYSVDIYVAETKKVHGIITRKREFVVDGESQITSSIRIEPLERLCSTIAERLELYGPVVFQAIQDAKNQWHIIECNPRFGGASTLSIAMGVDHFTWFFQEALNQQISSFNRAAHEKTQVRYPQDLVLPL